jgi:hypothetical protein
LLGFRAGYRWPAAAKETTSMDDTLITEAELDGLAALAGLTIPTHCRGGVRLHLATARRMLHALEPLAGDADELALAPVFDPAPGSGGAGSA